MVLLHVLFSDSPGGSPGTLLQVMQMAITNMYSLVLTFMFSEQLQAIVGGVSCDAVLLQGQPQHGAGPVPLADLNAAVHALATA